MLACCSDIDRRTDGIVLWLLNIRLNDMLINDDENDGGGSVDYVLVIIRLWHTVLFCCKRCGAVKEMPSLLIFNVQFFIFSRYSDTCTQES